MRAFNRITSFRTHLGLGTARNCRGPDAALARAHRRRGVWRNHCTNHRRNRRQRLHTCLIGRGIGDLPSPHISGPLGAQPSDRWADLLQVRERHDRESWEVREAGIVGEELLAAGELCGGSVNGIRQLEAHLRPQAGGGDQHFTTHGHDL